MPCLYFEKKRTTGIYTQCTKRFCGDLQIQGKGVCTRHHKLLSDQLKKSGRCSFNDDKVDVQRNLFIEQPPPPPPPPPQQQFFDDQEQEQEPIDNKTEELTNATLVRIKRRLTLPLTPRDEKGKPIEPEKKQKHETAKRSKPPAPAKHPIKKDIPKNIPPELAEVIAEAMRQEEEHGFANEEQENEYQDQPQEAEATNNGQSNYRKSISQNRIMHIGFIGMIDALEKIMVKYNLNVQGSAGAIAHDEDIKLLLEEFIYDIMPEMKTKEQSAGKKLALLCAFTMMSQSAYNFSKADEVKQPIPKEEPKFPPVHTD